MKTTRFNPPLASVTSATPNTAVALAPANTRARLATYTVSSANTAPVTIGPGATLASAVVAAGGSGYVVGDTWVLSGGTFTSPAILTVLTLSGSAAATVGVVDPGCYSVMPSSPASVTGGTGTLATLTLTATAASGAYTVQPGQSCPLWAGDDPARRVPRARHLG